MTAQTATQRPLSERGITLWGLFRCFLVIGVTGFGGVLPVVLHELVTRRRWITREEFTEILSICQILPGPNIINISVVMGMHAAGWRGSVMALSGLLAMPMVIGIVLVSLYTGFSEVPQVQGAVRAIAAAAAGLLCGVFARLWWPLRSNAVVAVIGLLVIGAVAWLRLPLVVIIAVLGPASVALSLWWTRRDG